MVPGPPDSSSVCTSVLEQQLTLTFNRKGAETGSRDCSKRAKNPKIVQSSAPLAGGIGAELTWSSDSSESVSNGGSVGTIAPAGVLGGDSACRVSAPGNNNNSGVVVGFGTSFPISFTDASRSEPRFAAFSQKLAAATINGNCKEQLAGMPEGGGTATTQGLALEKACVNATIHPLDKHLNGPSTTKLARPTSESNTSLPHQHPTPSSPSTVAATQPQKNNTVAVVAAAAATSTAGVCTDTPSTNRVRTFAHAPTSHGRPPHTTLEPVTATTKTSSSKNFQPQQNPLEKSTSAGVVVAGKHGTGSGSAAPATYASTSSSSTPPSTALLRQNRQLSQSDSGTGAPSSSLHAVTASSEPSGVGSSLAQQTTSVALLAGGVSGGSNVAPVLNGHGGLSSGKRQRSRKLHLQRKSGGSSEATTTRKTSETPSNPGQSDSIHSQVSDSARSLLHRRFFPAPPPTTEHVKPLYTRAQFLENLDSCASFNAKLVQGRQERPSYRDQSTGLVFTKRNKSDLANRPGSSKINMQERLNCQSDGSPSTNRCDEQQSVTSSRNSFASQTPFHKNKLITSVTRGPGLKPNQIYCYPRTTFYRRPRVNTSHSTVPSYLQPRKAYATPSSHLEVSTAGDRSRAATPSEAKITETLLHDESSNTSWQNASDAPGEHQATARLREPRSSRRRGSNQVTYIDANDILDSDENEAPDDDDKDKDFYTWATVGGKRQNPRSCSTTRSRRRRRGNADKVPKGGPALDKLELPPKLDERRQPQIRVEDSASMEFESPGKMKHGESMSSTDSPHLPFSPQSMMNRPFSPAGAGSPGGPPVARHPQMHGAIPPHMLAQHQQMLLQQHMRYQHHQAQLLQRRQVASSPTQGQTTPGASSHASRSNTPAANNQPAADST